MLKSFLYVWFGCYIDTLIPAESISGEIAKVYLVTREYTGTSGKVIASLISHRIMGTLVNIVSLFIGVLILCIEGPFNSDVFYLSSFILIITTTGVVLMILLTFNEKWLQKFLFSMVRFVKYITRNRVQLGDIEQKALHVSKMFHEAINDFRNAKKIVYLSLLFHLCSWVLSLGVSYLVFLSVGFQIQWGVLIITFSLMTAIKGIPLGIPFEAGLPETTMTWLYADVFKVVSPSIGITVTILDRMINVWLKFFIGFGVQQWLGIEIGKITEPIRKE